MYLNDIFIQSIIVNLNPLVKECAQMKEFSIDFIEEYYLNDIIFINKLKIMFVYLIIDDDARISFFKQALGNKSCYGYEQKEIIKLIKNTTHEIIMSLNQSIHADNYKNMNIKFEDDVEAVMN